MPMPSQGVVAGYMELGLRLGRHIDGLVDAYYGPKDLAHRIESEPAVEPGRLVDSARRLLGDLDAGAPLEDGPPGPDAPLRRKWLRAQVVGLHTTAQKLAGQQFDYAEEVELCYGVAPRRTPEEALAEAHATLDAVMPGSGSIAERFATWRESQAVPPEKLEAALASLAEDLRERTHQAFGLPDGESVEFVLVSGQPWSGFNYYLGDLRSRVAINTDLPVLSTSLAHLVAHEAYPGHHTEHTRKEVRLVRQRNQLEESIFLVGTPQCLLAEGLADLGLEIVLGERPEAIIAEHMNPLGIPYDPEVVAAVAAAAEVLSGARANAAFRLHADGADPEVVVGELARWALLSPQRAEKAVEFLLDPTWRTYITCYVEGLALCRSFVRSKPERFERLISDQMLPSDLVEA